MEREFRPRFPLQFSFLVNKLRGEFIFRQEIFRKHFLARCPRLEPIYAPFLLDAAVVACRHAERQQHLNSEHLACVTLLVRAGHVRIRVRHQLLHRRNFIAGSCVQVRRQRADLVQGRKLASTQTLEQLPCSSARYRSSP